MPELAAAERRAGESTAERVDGKVFPFSTSCSPGRQPYKNCDSPALPARLAGCSAEHPWERAGCLGSGLQGPGGAAGPAGPRVFYKNRAVSREGFPSAEHPPLVGTPRAPGTAVPGDPLPVRQHGPARCPLPWLRAGTAEPLPCPPPPPRPHAGPLPAPRPSPGPTAPLAAAGGGRRMP